MTIKASINFSKPNVIPEILAIQFFFSLNVETPFRGSHPVLLHEGPGQLYSNCFSVPWVSMNDFKGKDNTEMCVYFYISVLCIVALGLFLA